MTCWKRPLPVLLHLLIVIGPLVSVLSAWQLETPAGIQPPPAQAETPTVSVLVRSSSSEGKDGQVKPASVEIEVEEEGLGLVEESAATRVSLQATSFSGLIAGESTAEQVRQELGEPTTTLSQSGMLVQTYMLEPYDRVGVVLRADLLESIHVQLAEPVQIDELCKQLELPAAQGVDLPVTDGELQTRLYAKHGVSLYYLVLDGAILVQKVDFHRIRQHDLLRVAKELEHREYIRALELARISQQLDPDLAEAFAIEARVTARAGQIALALNALTRVSRLDPADNQSRLLQAQLWAQVNRRQMAIKQAREIRNNSEVAPLVRAQATLVLAELIGQAGDADAALQYFKEAIERASQAAKDTSGSDRDTAILVLIEAHRAVAREIARGEWHESEKVVAIERWLDVASELGEQLQSRQAAPVLLELEGLAARLEIQRGLQVKFDETAISEQFFQLGESLIEQSTDELFQQEVHWQIGRGLFSAARLAKDRGAFDEAIAQGMLAHKHLKAAMSPREEDLEGKALIGGISFLVGSQHAIARQDHEQAVTWYQRALPFLNHAGMENSWTRRGWHGERFVSMGLSFWKTGDRERGLELTEQGIAWVEKAVQQDGFPRRHLEVPYGNASIMYQTLGRQEQARKMAERAAELQSKGDSGVQRR